jgi:hypothetical protein
MDRGRNSDGGLRDNNNSKNVKPRRQIADWVERETVALRILGFSFPKIADSITRAGRLEIRSAVPLPDGIEFPANYHVREVIVYKAYQRALTRERKLTIEQLRGEDNHRSDELYLAAQQKVAKGDPKAISAAVSVLEHKANVNGYKAATQHRINGNLDIKQDTDTDEEDAFQTAVLEAMTCEERNTIMEIVERAKRRVREMEKGKDGRALN